MNTQDVAAAGIYLSEEDLQRAEEFRRKKNTSVLVIVFADMEDSVTLRENLGEVQFELIRGRMMQVLMDTITQSDEGVVLKNIGDGVLAIFAEPSTAVERAIAVQNLLHGDPYIKVRLGMDMGQVAVERRGGLAADAFGKHVNRAARVTALADGGHILTTGTVWDSAEGWLRSTWYAHHVHGLQKVKGVPKALDIHEVYNANITRPIRRLSAPRVLRRLRARHVLAGVALVGMIVVVVLAGILWGDKVFGGREETMIAAITGAPTTAATTVAATTTAPWQARTSHNQADAGKAFDSAPETFWDSKTAQQPGMWYELDLGQIETIDRITIESPGRGFAVGYILSVSTDRTNWEVVEEISENWKSIDVMFTPRSVRYIKVEQTQHPHWNPPWLISEITVGR